MLGLRNKLSTQIHQMVSFFKRKPYILTLMVFGFFLIVFTWMYFSVLPLSSGDDQFFHFRFAEKIRTEGFYHAFHDFQTIYFSKIASHQYLIYYSFLFYLVLIPFTFISPLYLGMKLFAVVTTALAFTIFYFCLKNFSVRYPFFWTMFVFSITSTGSLWRFFLSRPYTFAPAILTLLILCLAKRKYLGIFLISFLYLFWHTISFFFPLMIVVCFSIFEKFYKNKIDKKILWASISGTGLSVIVVSIISPGFLLYIRDIVLAVPFLSKIDQIKNLAEGGEVYPAPIFDYINGNILLFAAFIISVSTEIAAYVKNRHEPRIMRSTLFFISIVFFLGAIEISARFNDYFIFFAGLYITLVFSHLITEFELKNDITRRGIIVGSIVLILYLFTANVLTIQQNIAKNGAPVETLQNIGSWLKENTQKGDIIFNTDWSWFSLLYYHSPDNNYVAGLEPRFLYTYNPQLYWLWWNIGINGYVCDKPECQDLQAEQAVALEHGNQKSLDWFGKEGNLIAETISTEFKSHYIFSSYQNVYLNAVLDNNKHFKKVYGGDRAYYIYKID